MSSGNMFDNLLSMLGPYRWDVQDELEHYLGSDPVYVEDALAWWIKWREDYPCLSHMVIDFLMIPGMLLYSCQTPIFNNFLSSYICIYWTHLQQGLHPPVACLKLVIGAVDTCTLVPQNIEPDRFVHDSDVKTGVILPEVEEEDEDVKEGWNRILVKWMSICLAFWYIWKLYSAAIL